MSDYRLVRRMRDVGKPKSIELIRGIAAFELLSNPTITKYRFIDGAEVGRRSANPFVGMRDAFGKVQVAFEKFGNEIIVSMARARQLEQLHSSIGFKS